MHFDILAITIFSPEKLSSFFSLKIFLKEIICNYVYVCRCMHIRTRVHKGQRHEILPETGVTGSHQLSDLSAANWSSVREM